MVLAQLVDQGRCNSKLEKLMFHESMFETVLAVEDFMSIFLPVVFGYVASCLALIIFN